MRQDKQPIKPKQDRLLKQLPLSERRRQVEIRRMILSDQLWRKAA